MSFVPFGFPLLHSSDKNTFEGPAAKKYLECTRATLTTVTVLFCRDYTVSVG